ncbi:MAG: carboxypeptidase-like regulatory domain-containing protein, partial [Pedobacter sp.]
MKKLNKMIATVGLFCCFFRLVAQERTWGKIIDTNGRAIRGANVLITPGNVKLASDASGVFNYRLKAGQYTFKISCLGYEAFEQEISLPVSGILTFRLIEHSQTLGEVTINTGYQKLSKERSVGSFVQLDKAQLDRQFSGDV